MDMSLRANIVSVAISKQNRGNPVQTAGLNKRQQAFLTTLQKAVQVAFNLYEYCRYNACGVDKKSYDFLLDCHDLNESSNLAMTLVLFSGSLKLFNQQNIRNG